MLSTFGVAFVPDHHKVASELLRICRPGGKIALANWTPDDFALAFGKATTLYAPKSEAPSPWNWGDEAYLKELFGSAVDFLEVATRQFTYRYRAPEDYFQEFSSYYGPIMTSFNNLDAAAQGTVRAMVDEAAHKFNFADDGTLVLPINYLEAIMLKK